MNINFITKNKLSSHCLLVILAAIVSFYVLYGVQGLVFAHTSGASLEREVGEYKIDVGYDPVEIIIKDGVRFDFEIKEAGTGANVTYDRVWVKVQQGQKVYFAGGLSKASFGPTTLVYDFAEAGAYQLYVRYEKDDINLAQTTFDLTVQDNSAPKKTSLLPIWLGVSGVLGLAIGTLIGKFVFIRKRKVS